MVEGDNVLVFARFRPFSTSELRGVAGNTDRNGNIDNGSNNGQSVIASLEKGAVKLRSHDITYPFDDVFASQTPQQHVFDCTARPFTNAIMQGFNATIFAYGQTGSGNTITKNFLSSPQITLFILLHVCILVCMFKTCR